MRLLALTLLLAAAGLAACGDLIGPRTDPVGTLSFRYSGARSGTFYTRGELRTNAQGMMISDSSAYALVYRSDRRYLLSIEAFQPQSTAHGIGIRLYFPFREPGIRTLSCSSPPPPAATPGTILGGVNFDTDRVPEPLFGVSFVPYYFTCGTVHVTRIADGRAQGTFEVRGVPLRSDSLAAGDTVYVTEGSFDVPLREWKGGT